MSKRFTFYLCLSLIFLGILIFQSPFLFIKDEKSCEQDLGNFEVWLHRAYPEKGSDFTFKKLIKSGFKSVEIDGWLTENNDIIITHDKLIEKNASSLNLVNYIKNTKSYVKNIWLDFKNLNLDDFLKLNNYFHDNAKEFEGIKLFIESPDIITLFRLQEQHKFITPLLRIKNYGELGYREKLDILSKISDHKMCNIAIKGSDLEMNSILEKLTLRNFNIFTWIANNSEVEFQFKDFGARVTLTDNVNPPSKNK